jgi:hypothetical protein
MSAISYRGTPAGTSVNVYVGNKCVGTIKPDGRHFVFFPKGRNAPTQCLGSVAQIKKHLESDRPWEDCAP